ncbi:hypothetical protein GCM10023196_026080 [Actinoallomurus vinaceus]|uniref:Uncharacterized protein n=1 Tax=Actinoallomurus vinaceus TaxID=1080074 RepID=A0ABP8U7V4_9ACTN
MIGPGAGGAAGAGLPSGFSAPGTASNVLPLIAAGQPRLPLVAPAPIVPRRTASAAPMTLRAEASPLGLGPTVYRLVCAQVAWLIVLLVSLSLLLTQGRLNHRGRHAAHRRGR